MVLWLPLKLAFYIHKIHVVALSATPILKTFSIQYNFQGYYKGLNGLKFLRIRVASTVAQNRSTSYCVFSRQVNIIASPKWFAALLLNITKSCTLNL